MTYLIGRRSYIHVGNLMLPRKAKIAGGSRVNFNAFRRGRQMRASTRSSFEQLLIRAK